MAKPALSPFAVLLSLSLPVVACNDTARRPVGSETPARSAVEVADESEAALEQARADARDEIRREITELDQQLSEVRSRYEREHGAEETERFSRRLGTKLDALRADLTRIDRAPARMLSAIKRDLQVGVDDASRALIEARQSI